MTLPSNHRKPWTKADDDVMEANRELQVFFLCKLLGRTFSAVENRRGVLSRKAKATAIAAKPREPRLYVTRAEIEEMWQERQDYLALAEIRALGNALDVVDAVPQEKPVGLWQKMWNTLFSKR